ncbi:MAG: DUF3185 domain-containing protein [Acidobacteriia bacterium]|nr:DUF3185 domain-containing protein [Terriglobia bacterium]
MKTSTVFAIVLIAVGIMAFAYQGFTYTTREKVVDLGPVHVTTERTKTIPLPPIVGMIAAVSGVVLLVVGRKKA